MKNILYLLFLVTTFAYGQTAPNYYSNIDFEEQGEPLKQQLANLLTTTHTYTVSYDELWSILKQTDRSPDDANKVMLIYGWDDYNAEDDDDITRDKEATCGNGNPCTDETWNREHVYPRGLDNSASDNQGPTADPHMLRSSDVEMNSLRANHLFGEGSGEASYINNNGDFYPGDNWKGDVARIIMYMYVRYGEDWNPNYTGAGANTYHTDMPNIFLEWNAEDPVSEYEMNRNNYVNNYQGNRNPFIDNPYLATVIWGGPEADNTWPGTLGVINTDSDFAGIQVYPNPTKDWIYMEGITDDTRIELYDNTGKILLKDKGINRIHLQQPGVYILRVNINGTVFTEKVIKK